MTPDQFEQWQAEQRELELRDALRFLKRIPRRDSRPRPKNELGRFEMLTVGDFEFLRQCGISID